ncbi:pyridoxal-phosphate-dependent aminotransferase family protein [Deferribacter abyssi]|uniref:pyridoxal-phosphate-dependent aminotransferase family protein n=1 Tax=Deferribacter abyssi TaxID=213806 RepID=UPI003C20368B
MIKKYLLAPGPTMVPESVLLEMAKPMMHHRTSEFSSIFANVREKLKPIFGTKNECLLISGSGTAAMEAAVVNTLSPGDKVLVVNAGKFGKRWAEICTKFQLEVVTIDLEWGRSVRVEQVESALIEHPDAKALFIQASETSTTAYHPVEKIGNLVKLFDSTLFIVDGITSVGVVETKMDEWGIDILVTGSQKAFMLPPGLSIIAMSDKAWKFVEQSKLPKYYLDLVKEKKAQGNDTTAYTPAVSLIIGLNKVLDLMHDEGLENVYLRHSICANATRKAVKALGLQLLAKDIPSNAATGFYLPDGIDGGKLVKFLRESMGVTFAGGQDHLKGKIMRISHLGYHDVFDTIIAISALELGLKKFGFEFEMGAGIKAAEDVIYEHRIKGL